MTFKKEYILDFLFYDIILISFFVFIFPIKSLFITFLGMTLLDLYVYFFETEKEDKNGNNWRNKRRY